MTVPDHNSKQNKKENVRNQIQDLQARITALENEISHLHAELMAKDAEVSYYKAELNLKKSEEVYLRQQQSQLQNEYYSQENDIDY